MDDKEQQFFQTWRVCAQEGACDSLGGEEFLRVKSEWEDAGRPPDIRGFIVRRANEPPIPVEWTLKKS